MKLNRQIYTAGCWSFGIICGVGHIAVDLAPKPEDAQAIQQVLRDFPINMVGTQTNAFLLSFGVSMIMGLMLIAYGVINLMVLRDTPKPSIPSRGYQIINIIFALAAFALAWAYLFTLPIIFTAIASVCFVVSFIGDLKNQSSIAQTA